MGPDLEAILDDAAAYPDCAIIQAYAASMYVYAQLRSEAAKAAPLLDLARQRVDRLTERERLFVEGGAAGCGGDYGRAISIHERIAGRWPCDVVAAKLAEFHFFQTGESARQLAFMQSIAEPNADNSHLQSMYAFALELCGRREESETVARAALRLNPRTPWAQHCLAHVFAGRSRIAEGIAELEGYADGWRSFGRYIQAHNWFHLATLYLAGLDFPTPPHSFPPHISAFFPDTVA